MRYLVLLFVLFGCSWWHKNTSHVEASTAQVSHEQSNAQEQRHKVELPKTTYYPPYTDPAGKFHRSKVVGDEGSVTDDTKTSGTDKTASSNTNVNAGQSSEGGGRLGLRWWQWLIIAVILAGAALAVWHFSLIGRVVTLWNRLWNRGRPSSSSSQDGRPPSSG